MSENLFNVGKWLSYQAISKSCLKCQVSKLTLVNAEALQVLLELSLFCI